MLRSYRPILARLAYTGAGKGECSYLYSCGGIGETEIDFCVLKVPVKFTSSVSLDSNHYQYRLGHGL